MALATNPRVTSVLIVLLVLTSSLTTRDLTPPQHDGGWFPQTSTKDTKSPGDSAESTTQAFRRLGDFRQSDRRGRVVTPATQPPDRTSADPPPPTTILTCRGAGQNDVFVHFHRRSAASMAAATANENRVLFPLHADLITDSRSGGNRLLCLPQGRIAGDGSPVYTWLQRGLLGSAGQLSPW
jgi:hypothetical protein